MSSITLSIASTEDDVDLRLLLRQNPMPGRLQITLEREPNFFIGANVEGPYHQTILVRHSATRQLIALVTRSVRQVYVNGVPGSLGYLSQFRLAPGFLPTPRTMAQVGGMLHQLHHDDRTRLYLNSIIADNIPARRLLTAGLPGMPRFHEYARYHTLAIYTRRSRRLLPLPTDLHMAQGQPQHIPSLLECLARNGRRYQFTPVWTRDSFLQSVHTPNLHIEDFWLALDGSQVVGCVALWDQTSFKQTVVRGYAGWLGRTRRLVNATSWLTGMPKLPAPDHPFRFCFASHIAVDQDDQHVFAALIRQAYRATVHDRYSYLMLGLAETHPHLDLIRRSYAHIDYASQFYLSGWEEDMQPILAAIDNRPPGLETCLL